MSDTEPIVKYSILLPKSLHRKLKQLSLNSDTSMQDLLRAAAERLLRAEELDIAMHGPPSGGGVFLGKDYEPEDTEPSPFGDLEQDEATLLHALLKLLRETYGRERETMLGVIRSALSIQIAEIEKERERDQKKAG